MLQETANTCSTTRPAAPHRFAINNAIAAGAIQNGTNDRKTENFTVENGCHACCLKTRSWTRQGIIARHMTTTNPPSAGPSDSPRHLRNASRASRARKKPRPPRNNHCPPGPNAFGRKTWKYSRSVGGKNSAFVKSIPVRSWYLAYSVSQPSSQLTWATKQAPASAAEL